MNVDLVEYHDHGVADACRMLLMYFYIKRYFIKTKIRMSTGKRYQKSSGIPSGSYFAQLIRSMCNSFIINWLSLQIDGSFPYDSICLGDESLIATKSMWSIEKCQELVQTLGMRLNMEKTQIQSDLHSIRFLGNLL